MRARTRTTAPRGARRKWSSTAIEIEASVASAVSVATTSAGILRGAALRLLDVPVRILAPVPTPAPSRARNRPPRRLHPRIRRSPTLRRRACLPQRRTRSRIRTERARCSSTTSRQRLASPLLGGGCTFSRATSKSVRPTSSPFICLSITRPYLLITRSFDVLLGFLLRFTPHPSPKCVPHRSRPLGYRHTPRTLSKTSEHDEGADNDDETQRTSATSFFVGRSCSWNWAVLVRGSSLALVGKWE